MKFDHIGFDTSRHCMNCQHHHCTICNTCHRCGCKDYRRRKLSKKERQLGAFKAKPGGKEIDNRNS